MLGYLLILINFFSDFLKEIAISEDLLVFMEPFNQVAV